MQTVTVAQKDRNMTSVVALSVHAYTAGELMIEIDR